MTLRELCADYVKHAKNWHDPLFEPHYPKCETYEAMSRAAQAVADALGLPAAGLPVKTCEAIIEAIDAAQGRRIYGGLASRGLSFSGSMIHAAIEADHRAFLATRRGMVADYARAETMIAERYAQPAIIEVEPVEIAPCPVPPNRKQRRARALLSAFPEEAS